MLHVNRKFRKLKSLKLVNVNGFTLIELIIVFVIILIISTLSIGYGRSIVDYTRLKTVVDAVKQQLYAARSRAIADPAIFCGVHFNLNTDSMSTRIFFDKGVSYFYEPGTDELILKQYMLPKGVQMSIPNGEGIINNVIVFRGNGSAKNGGSIDFKINKFTKRINVLASTGRIKVISP